MAATLRDEEEEVGEEVGSVVNVKFPAVSTLDRECCCVVGATEADS